jgi:hypothetical protein
MYVQPYGGQPYGGQRYAQPFAVIKPATSLWAAIKQEWGF